MIAPIYSAMSEREDFKSIKFLKIDGDEGGDDLLEVFGVECFPTFLFFKNGVKVDILEGASEDALEEKLRALLA